MSTHTVAARRTWFAIAPDGAEHDIVTSVGVPTLAAGGEWRATVSVGTMDSVPCSVAGVDSWQAICLAMKFAATRLSHYAADGWQFYWERGGDLASPEDLANVP